MSVVVAAEAASSAPPPVSKAFVDSVVAFALTGDIKLAELTPSRLLSVLSLHSQLLKCCSRGGKHRRS